MKTHFLYVEGDIVQYRKKEYVVVGVHYIIDCGIKNPQYDIEMKSKRGKVVRDVPEEKLKLIRKAMK